MRSVMLTGDKPLVCGMCGRRICDITIVRGAVALRTTEYGVGIPQGQVEEGRAPAYAGTLDGQWARDPNVRIFADKTREPVRYRIVHHHKGKGRGPLDRTVTTATLEKLYEAAVAANQREAVLR